MTAPAAPVTTGEREDLLDLPAFLHDVDVLRRHHGMTWAGVSQATGVPTTTLAEMRNGIRRPSLATYQKLMKWMDPTRIEYLRADTSPEPEPVG